MHDILIFTTQNDINFHGPITINSLPKHSSLFLEKLFIGFKNFDRNQIMRFEFFDSFGGDNIKLVMNINYIPSDNNIYVDEHVLNKINKTANAYLWIVSPWEAVIHRDKLMEHINNSPIKNEKVIVTTSNTEYAGSTIDGVKFTCIHDFWEGQYRHHIKHFSDVSYIHPNQKKKTLKSASKKFLSLNRNLKHHRVWTYYQLLNSPTWNESHVSYHLPSIAKEEGMDFKSFVNRALLKIDNKLKRKKVNQLYKNKTLDKLDSTWIINHKNDIIPYYHDSLFSIVTESLLDEQFITEKTFKPMMHGHPFVFLGSQKNLERLKLRGYETFEDVFGIGAIETPKQLEQFLNHVHKTPLEEWRQKIIDVWDRVEFNYFHFLGSTHDYEFFVNEINKITDQDRSKGYFCMAPWVHMSIWQKGEAFPCCVYDWRTPIGNIKDQGIAGAWNSEDMKNLRLEMLAGNAPKGCERCTKLDKQGIYSYRRKITEDYKHHLPLVDTTNEDGSVDKVNLAYFDIRFSNLCNMKCRSCGPHFSSKWAEDTVGKPVIIQIDHEEMWDEIEQYIDTIEEIYFTGGESLFMDQHYRLLDMIIANNKHPKLVYNSNGSKLEHKGKSVTDYWKKIKNNIEFQVSLDQIGKKAEYTRHGQKWSTIENNLKFIRDNIPNVAIIPNPTISVLNIMDLKEIIEYLFENKLVTECNINLNNILMTPEWMSIQILPKHLKRKVEENLNLFLYNSLDNYEMEPVIRNIYMDCIPKIINIMNESDESHRISEFKQEMQKLDKIREENFLEVFPELGELYE